MTRRSALLIWHIRYKRRLQRQIMEIAALSAAFLFLGLALSLAAYFSNMLVLDTPLLQMILDSTFPGIKEMNISIGREEEPQLGLFASLLFVFTEGGFLSPKSIVAEALPAFSMASLEVPTLPAHNLGEVANVPSSRNTEIESITSHVAPLEPKIYDVDALGIGSSGDSTVNADQALITKTSRSNVVDVIIYNTHSSEAYHGMIGANHQSDALDYAFGRWRDDAGVIGVASELEKQLTQLGVNVYRIKKIHDGEVFRLAYLYSEESVREALNQYQTAKLVIDIHRDAAPDSQPFRIPVQGQYAAQVSLVVATGERSSRNWDVKLTRELAARLISMINSRYPSLCRGAIFKTGAYNQHLHPGSLLIEVGNDCNTDAEAQYTARLIAPILRDFLLEVR
ncbi:MAG: stage II sporulation protein P [Firmicutes bacterium]|nr:stage II sporulation protein P [Bacillota bacterium]MDD4263777.1 stage II sporulation protein P [Bacillota bacterium]MDD4692926.1 stage II sporulation protein P [Bacillota bacterium]